MEKVKKPRFTIVYEGRDITAELTEYLINVEYVDNTSENSDEVQFTVEDTLANWRSNWYPMKGDKFALQIGYEGRMFDCGKFTVDEIELSGPPDVVTIRGLAAGVNSPVRTKTSKAFEGQPLREIAEEIAEKYGYEIIDEVERSSTFVPGTSGFEPEMELITRAETFVLNAKLNRTNMLALQTLLQGIFDRLVSRNREDTARIIRGALNGLAEFKRITNLNPVLIKSLTTKFRDTMRSQLDRARATLRAEPQRVTKTVNVLDGVIVERVTQNRETDLEFLRRISADYGIIFSLRDDKMIFMSIYDLQGREPVLSLDRKDLIRYNIKDKATEVYQACRVRHHDVKRNQVITKFIYAKDVPEINSEYEQSADTLEIHERVESDKQAEEKAKAALFNSNNKSQEGSISVQGDPLLVAGNNMQLTGMGTLSGKFRINKSTHRLSKSGYVTDCDIKRV